MATKAKVLIIEDDQVLARGFAEALKEGGYNVINSYDGADGIKKAVSEQPDLILLDVILPIKTGEEVIDALQVNEKTKKIPIIVDSNLYSTERETYFMHKGAMAYIPKSNLTPESLVELVDSALKK